MGQTSSQPEQEPKRPSASSSQPVKNRSPSPPKEPASKCQDLVKTQPNEATPLKRTRARRRVAANLPPKASLCRQLAPHSAESDDSERLWSRRANECGNGCCCCCCCCSVRLSASCEHSSPANVDNRSSLFEGSDCLRGCASRSVVEAPASERTSLDYRTFIATSRPLNEIKSMLAGGIGTVDKLPPDLNAAADSSTQRQVEAVAAFSRPVSNSEKGRTLLRRHAPQAPVTCPPAQLHLRRHEADFCERFERAHWNCQQQQQQQLGGNKQNSAQYSTKLIAANSPPIEPDLPATGARDSDFAPGVDLCDSKPSDVIKGEDKPGQQHEESGGGGTEPISESPPDSSEKLKLNQTATSTAFKPTQSSQKPAAPNQPATATSRRPTWNELAMRYGRTTRPAQAASNSTGAGLTSRMNVSAAAQLSYQSSSNSAGPMGPANHQQRPRRATTTRGSCFCHILCALAQTLFPILGAFKDYSLPGDLVADLTAGFTVAILHIPQGMAYGLLSGVEPIYGLYVSFVPVAVMALMSKSRHASYGTFAIISMLLVSAAGDVRESMRLELTGNLQAAVVGGASSPLVITDNHQPVEAVVQAQLKSQLPRQQLVQQAAVQSGGAPTPPPLESAQKSQQQQQNLLVDSSALSEAIELLLPSNIEILTCVCIVCGLLHITMSLLRLGVLSLVFSDQLVSSFTTAGAIHVLTSQLASLFDMNLTPISDELFKCARVWWQFAWSLTQGHFNGTTALLSLASILFLLTVKELIEPSLRRRFKRFTCLPSELVLMAALVGCSTYFKLAAKFNVKIIGHVPSGLPEPKVPNLELVPYVWKDSICIALISFAINLSIARTYAKSFRYELDPNQELFALGSANLLGSFFSCFPCSASLSRSSVQSSLNVKSQLSSIFSCCIVFTIVCYFSHILHDLPKSTLSCIIVVALKGILMQLGDFYENWRLSKLDALVWIITFVSVITFGVTLGLVLGILSSLLMIFFRLLTPNYSVLARLPNTEIYIDKEAFANCEEIEQVRIFRFNSALCYLNRTILKAKVEKLLPGVIEPTGFRAICSQFHQQLPESNRPKRIKFLVIDCSALAYCDFAGAATLIELIDDLADKKVCVLLAACPLKLIVMIEKMQRGAEVLSRNVYPTISDAVGQIKYLQSADSKQQTKPPAESGADKATGESSIIDLS